MTSKFFYLTLMSYFHTNLANVLFQFNSRLIYYFTFFFLPIAFEEIRPIFQDILVNLVLSSGAKMETLIIPAPSTKYLLITCLKLSKTVLGRLAAGRVTSRGGYPVLCRAAGGGAVVGLKGYPPIPPRLGPSLATFQDRASGSCRLLRRLFNL